MAGEHGQLTWHLSSKCCVIFGKKKKKIPTTTSSRSRRRGRGDMATSIPSTLLLSPSTSTSSSSSSSSSLSSSDSHASRPKNDRDVMDADQIRKNEEELDHLRNGMIEAIKNMLPCSKKTKQQQNKHVQETRFKVKY